MKKNILTIVHVHYRRESKFEQFLKLHVNWYFLRVLENKLQLRTFSRISSSTVFTLSIAYRILLR